MDWFPWGPEALGKAAAEDRPIFLSIGYSACHWCHVMERESFQDPETAEILNHEFVSIKVDREERPDIDSVYMHAVAAMTGSGGWPLNVFLLPDGTPFYGGTYFPPEGRAARYGSPGFPAVLRAVAHAFRNRRDELVSSGRALLGTFRVKTGDSGGLPVPEALDLAFTRIRGSFDPVHGGFGRAPKFPQPMVLDFLLRRHHRTGDRTALAMLETTLERIGRGGIRDHLAGGFHRYSTDERWLIPHFEKMLYDNSLLALLFTAAFQVTGRACFRRTAEETLDYLIREMRHPAGGFYGTQDAGSPESGEGVQEEGAHFVWSRKVIREVLGADARIFCRVFGVTEEGNFHGRNVLHMAVLPGEAAEEAGVSEESVHALLTRGRRRLLSVRESRPKPFRDEKIITAWNGLAIEAFSRAACAFGRPDYLAAAELAAGFVLKELRRGDGRLMRSWKDGDLSVPAFLEDHALLARGLLALDSAGGGQCWLKEALALGSTMTELFRDTATGAFHDTGPDHGKLFVRPAQVSDGGTPSGLSAAAGVFAQLWRITGGEDCRSAAEAILYGSLQEAAGMPLGHGGMLGRLESWIGTAFRIVITGGPGTPGHRELMETARSVYLPDSMVVSPGPDEPGSRSTPGPSGDRADMNGRAEARVCLEGACLPPVTEAAELRALLTSRGPLPFHEGP